MKITKLESIFVKPRWHFLKIHTDEGITGLGEPIVEGRARTVAMAVSEMEGYLIGKDPRDIAKHWQVLYGGTFYRGGPVLVSALSGVDQALWDILGKWHGVPIHKLMGGAVRDRIRVYAHVGGSTIDEMKANVQQKVKEGYTTFKTGLPGGPNHMLNSNAWVDDAVEKIAEIRSALPPEVDLAMDCHGRLTPAQAIVLIKELEPYRLLFVEEPCLPENVDAMVKITNSVSTPIASGERLFTRWGFRELIEKQAVAVVQPDICHCGGITEALKIAAMAETYYIAIAPHNPLGPISLAAGIQVDALCQNFLCQEQVHLGEGYIKNPFVVKDGYIDLPTAPGLGVELDEEALVDKINIGEWDTPRIYDVDDGAFGIW